MNKDLHTTLTRQVLFEKLSPFHQIGQEISNKTWNITFEKINDKEILDKIEYIVSKIICPIAGTDLYEIGEEEYKEYWGKKEKTRAITVYIKYGNVKANKYGDNGYLGPYIFHAYYDVVSSLKGGIELKSLVIDYLNILCVDKWRYSML